MNQAKEINKFDLSSTSDADRNNNSPNKNENASGDGIYNLNNFGVCKLSNHLTFR
jgi:hypothetical protein